MMITLFPAVKHFRPLTLSLDCPFMFSGELCKVLRGLIPVPSLNQRGRQIFLPFHPESCLAL